MANDRITSGGNRLEAFSLASNAFDTSQYVFNLTLSTDIAYNDDGTLTFTLDQEKDNEALQTFIDTYGPDPDSVEVEASRYEDATTSASATTGSQPNIGIVAYGGTNDDGRKVYEGVARVMPGTGSSKWEAGKPSKPKVVIQTVKAPAATTIAAAKFSTALVTTPGSATTIAEGAKYKVEWLTPAT